MSERDSGGADVSITVNILTKKGDLFYSLAEACIVKDGIPFLTILLYAPHLKAFSLHLGLI